MARSFEKRKTEAQTKIAATFNKNAPIGTPVSYRTDLGKVVETKTRSEASVLGGHTAVVWLDGIAGCVSVERVTPNLTI